MVEPIVGSRVGDWVDAGVLLGEGVLVSVGVLLRERVFVGIEMIGDKVIVLVGRAATAGDAWLTLGTVGCGLEPQATTNAKSITTANILAMGKP
jgi:hypothetical protein